MPYQQPFDPAYYYDHPQYPPQHHQPNHLQNHQVNQAQQYMQYSTPGQQVQHQQPPPPQQPQQQQQQYYAPPVPHIQVVIPSRRPPVPNFQQHHQQPQPHPQQLSQPSAPHLPPQYYQSYQVPFNQQSFNENQFPTASVQQYISQDQQYVPPVIPSPHAQSHYQTQSSPQYQPRSQSQVPSPAPPTPISNPQLYQGQFQPVKHTHTPSPVMQQIQQLPPRVLQSVELPNVPRQQVAAKLAPSPEPTPAESEPDYAIILLGLADEYFDQARKLKRRTEDYCRFIATGLGCIESVLNNFKLPTLREAQLSLRYAQLLLDETENYDDAETVLTKAIDLCERNKLLDLKYAMQLLLARVLYQSRPKAAIKDLQAIIEDVEAYKHLAWEYTFRFQLAMFHCSTSTLHDLHAAATQLEKLARVAQRNKDNTVLAFVSLVEAQLHLQNPNADAISACQRALAIARSLQLNPDVSGNPQMLIMMEFVDMCCSVRESNISQLEAKRKIMQDVLFEVLDKWPSNNLIYLRLEPQSLNGLQTQEGGLVTERGGKHYLTFSWMGETDAEVFGYLLCAVSSAYKNSHDGSKAEKFIETGLELVRKPSGATPITLGTLENSSYRRKLIECRLLIELVFLRCVKGQWQEAESVVAEASKFIQSSDNVFPKSTECILNYLSAAIKQGTGHLDAALKLYLLPTFNLTQFEPAAKMQQSSSSRILNSEQAIIRNISILATMNAILIIRNPTHPKHAQMPIFITQVSTLVPLSNSKPIKAFHDLLQAILQSRNMLESKRCLAEALSTAQLISNTQTTALILSLMQERLFQGQVGDQAIKCAQAASAQVRKWGDPTWLHVTSAMEAEAYEIHNMKELAERKRVETRKRMEGVPEMVRRDIEAK